MKHGIAVGLLAFASATQAVTVVSASPSTDLIGSRASVVHTGGAGRAAALFVAGAGGAVIATAVGAAGFTLEVSAGDTAAATWTLTNTDANPVFLNHITSVTIDLIEPGISLFDKGTVPSTPGSLDGVAGVVGTAGRGIASATELNVWADPLNAGDMFTAVTISFAGGGLDPAGAAGGVNFASWTDDTDAIAVPEPAIFALWAGGLLTVVWVSARRQRARAAR